MKNLPEIKDYDILMKNITETYQSERSKAIQAIKSGLVNAHWQTGKYIVEFEQGGNEKSEFGSLLLDKLSEDLKAKHGAGFSKSNLVYMRLFYLKYPIGVTLSHQLSWSHYYELLKISDDLERGFYEKQSILEGWSIRELRRQKKASLYLRVAASTDKKRIVKLAKEGRRVEKPIDIIRDPYIFDFLKIPAAYQLTEAELEKRIIQHLQNFLLELGKGFAFIGSQYRITLGNRHHFVDLVFYHRILKCFVLIDLKREEAGYQDIGQMNMYLGYFESEENTVGDNPPIGIVLAREKDELLIKYAMHGISTQLFISKYKLHLPDEEELRRELELIVGEEE